MSGDWLLAIVIWTVVVIELVLLSRYIYRYERRRREWRKTAAAIPWRDLRQEYRKYDNH
jgi:hypothetical protein